MFTVYTTFDLRIFALTFVGFLIISCQTDESEKYEFPESVELNSNLDTPSFEFENRPKNHDQTNSVRASNRYLIIRKCLGTDNPSRNIFHEAIAPENNLNFAYSGILIGLEKTTRNRLNLNKPFSLSESGLRPWSASPVSYYKESWNNNLEAVLNDEDRIFVSHLIGFEEKRKTIYRQKMYSIYDQDVEDLVVLQPQDPTNSSSLTFRNGEPFRLSQANCASVTERLNTFQRGQAALEDLKGYIRTRFEAAASEGAPYSHLIIMSKGWDDSPKESIDFFNQFNRGINSHISNFRPFIIGFTWPSVWASETRLIPLSQAAKLASYTVIADDADEIGYTHVNYLINNIAVELAPYTNGKTILIGHSFGARVLTRGLHSRPILQSAATAPDGYQSLMIGLQGAFDISRLQSGKTSESRIFLANQLEGAPYLLEHSLPTKSFYTWSKNDNANPLSVFLTYAHHVGGVLGANDVLESENTDFDIRSSKFGPIDSEEGCEIVGEKRKITYYDASGMITYHGDVKNEQITRSVASLINCF